MIKFDDDNKVAAHTATKCIYKIEMPNVQFLKNVMPMKSEHYEVTVILDGYDDFIKDNLKDFNDIFEFCLKSTPPVQLLIIKESLIDYPLDVEDITDMKSNPILHSSGVHNRVSPLAQIRKTKTKSAKHQAYAVWLPMCMLGRPCK